MTTAPEPLCSRITRKVRFEEVDALGYVWHGHYPSYFEDARVALGEIYGLSYLDFKREEVIAPIKSMMMDYVKPMVYGESYEVEAILHYNEATRLDFDYVIRDKAGDLVTQGSSIQLFLDNSNQLLILHPPFYKKICDRWLAGEFGQ
jgi:acyl-CoA thioester hydrolase